MSEVCTARRVEWLPRRNPDKGHAHPAHREAQTPIPALRVNAFETELSAARPCQQPPLIRLLLDPVGLMLR